MSRQQSERNIPHLRDIFGFQGNWGGGPRGAHDAALRHKLQDLHIGDKSSSSANDSAVSVGSASEDELAPKSSSSSSSSSSSKKKKQRSSRRDNTRTLTERDVKHLERHLSMKKTIRKKIMRDLQQAFVEDPNEFRVEDISPEQLKANINIQSLSFGAPQKAPAESSFLDMLRGGGGGNVAADYDDDSGHGGSPTRGSPSADYEDDDYGDADPAAADKKTSFWRRFTMKGRSKR